MRFQIDFSKPCRVHFIGIGGISMSGLAEILLTRGFTVSGSDSRRSAITDRLESMGARIMYGQSADNVSADLDLVVYTAAIHPDNPEFVRCQELGLEMMDRASMLGQVMSHYPLSIAVAGTHGKTTTTSMTANILMEADLDPTISVGGILRTIQGNIRIGHSDYFVTEACEYTNSFLRLNPLIGIVLNVEEDHMDFFKDLADIRRSFRRFAELLPAEGTLVLCGDIPDPEELTDGLVCRVVTYGLKEDCDYSAVNIAFDDQGIPSFDLLEHGSPAGTITLGVAGLHNVKNALAATAAVRALGVPMEAVITGLAGYMGADRRFEHKGVWNGVTIIDDYAHHPTEIRATLQAAAAYPHRELWCVFQPHTYTRTKAFLTDFADALMLADHVVLADIYAAREKDPGDIHANDIGRILAENGRDVHYFPTFEEIENYLSINCRENDLLITMGAGNIVDIGESLLKK